MAETRREFLATSLPRGLLIPIAGTLGARTRGPAGAPRRILVALHADGGWDMLSMLVPASDAIYRKVRPRLAIPAARTLPLAPGAKAAWHPALAPFKALFDRGDLAVVQNVGYPNPDLSHAESALRWHTGRDRPAQPLDGWLARYLRSAYRGGSPIPALDLEPLPSPTFQGALVPNVVSIDALELVVDPANPFDQDTRVAALRANAKTLAAGADPAVRTLAARTLGALRVAETIRATGKNYRPAVPYPQSALTPLLQIAARLIRGGLDTHLYALSLPGFDTHAFQALSTSPEQGVLADRLGEIAAAVRAFLDDVAAHGAADEVVMLVWSEFGRRVPENGSLGTDHGEGGVAFLAGKPVRGGLYGNYPDLARIHRPGQSYSIPFDRDSTDFRSIYATLLERWLGVASQPILGVRMPLLGAL